MTGPSVPLTVTKRVLIGPKGLPKRYYYKGTIEVLKGLPEGFYGVAVRVYCLGGYKGFLSVGC